MEAIALAIKSSLVPFLTEKLSGVVDSDDITTYIDEWLDSAHTPKKAAPKKRTKKPADPEQAEKPVVDAGELLSKSAYEKMRVDDLKKILKARGVEKPTGTKATLIAMILGENDDVPRERSKPKRKRAPPKSSEMVEESDDEVPAAKGKAKAAKPSSTVKVIDIIQPEVVDIVVDKYGNSIHQETGLVFNKSNEVIAHVTDDGQLRPLDKRDLEVCKRYNFSYILESDIEESDEE